MTVRRGTVAVLAAVVSSGVPCQDDAELARVLDAWGAALRDGTLNPRHPVDDGELSAAVYGQLHLPGNALADARERGRSHLAVLCDLLEHAEQRGGAAMARAVLGIAGAGHDRQLSGFAILEVREVGHWTLVRMDDQEATELVLRYAAGTVTDGVPVSHQVAALKTLGLRKDDFSRRLLERRLLAAEGSVRLAAAESLGARRPMDSLETVIKALRTERNTLVLRALVGALERMLRAHRDEIIEAVRRRAVIAGLRRIGFAGMRTDLAILDLVDRNPMHLSVPPLIRVLAGWGAGDLLLDTVNKRANRVVRYRAWQILRRLTGAILPFEDPKAWRSFWEKEKDNVVLPDPDTSRSKTSTFFGIPVTGREIAFVIDISGSMNEIITTQDFSGIPRESERIDVAREQVLAAANHMDRSSRYHLVTFASEVLLWNRRPIRPSAESYRALVEVASRIRAGGSTRLYGALMAVLDAKPGQPGELHEVDEMFVLTDGEPSGEVNDTETILDAVADLNGNRRVRIHSVHIGGAKGVDLMQRLAEENEGVFVRR